jgi:hypothetical protein
METRDCTDDVLALMLAAAEWKLMEAEKEALELRQETPAALVNELAHGILADPGSPKRYTRAGQYPGLSAVSDDGCSFLVANGYDDRDDFTVSFTWEQLARL